jgi:hypothetical protein
MGKERDCVIGDCERELETIGDREKLFRNGGERLQRRVVAEFDDVLP